MQHEASEQQLRRSMMLNESAHSRFSALKALVFSVSLQLLIERSFFLPAVHALSSSLSLKIAHGRPFFLFSSAVFSFFDALISLASPASVLPPLFFIHRTGFHRRILLMHAVPLPPVPLGHNPVQFHPEAL
jgi:hypothetical protein